MHTQLVKIVRSVDPAAQCTPDGVRSRGALLPWVSLESVYRRARGNTGPLLAWVQARTRARPGELFPRAVGPPHLIQEARDTWGDSALAFLAQVCADVTARVPDARVSAETWQADPCTRSVSVFVVLDVGSTRACLLVTPGAGLGGRLIGNLHASAGGPLRLADVDTCVNRLSEGVGVSTALAAA